jgi:hypothetical protein
VNEMNPGWRSAHERAATLTFVKQAASARLDAWQKTAERKPSDKGTAASLLLRFLYWIYEAPAGRKSSDTPPADDAGFIATQVADLVALKPDVRIRST